MALLPFAGQQLRLERQDHAVEVHLVLQRLLGIVVQVEIHPSVPAQDIALIWALLLVVPLDGLAMNIYAVLAVVSVPSAHRRPLARYDVPDEGHAGLPADDEPDVILIQRVDVLDAVEAAVLDDLHLGVTQDVKLPQIHLYGLHIGDVPRQAAVIEGKIGLLAEHEQQVDLRQRVIVLVLPVLHERQLLRIAGDGACVVGQIFILRTPEALKSEEARLGVLRYGSEELAAAPGRDAAPYGWV